MTNILDFIKPITEKVKLEQIIVWLKHLPLIFIKPRKFFNFFYSQDVVQQVFQIVLYTLLLLFFNQVIQYDPIAKFRYLFNLIVFTIPFIIIISIVNLIISKKNFNFWKIASFVYLSNIIFSFPITLFSSLFLYRENYNYSLIGNIFNACLMLFIHFYYWHLIFQKIKKIVLAYILSIFFINFLNLAITLSQIDYSTPGVLDPILTEIQVSVDKIKDNKGTLTIKKIETDNNHKEIEYVGLKINPDSGNLIKHGTIYFKNLANQNIAYLDTLTPKLKFETSRYILNDIRLYYKGMLSALSSEPCDTCLVKNEIFVTEKDSQFVAAVKTFKLDTAYTSHLRKFNNKADKLVKRIEASDFPFRVTGFLILPSSWILEKMDKKNDAGLNIVL